MFEHSVKVPRHYKVAANIFRQVSTEGGSVKTLLYQDKLRHFRINVLYALITETIKHAAVIDKILKSCNLLENEKRLDPWLAKILTAELLFGKKCLPGKSKPEQTILLYKERFDQYTSTHEDLKTQGPEIRRPRYVRVNTNLLSTSDAIGAFQEEGYKFIRCTSGSYDDYLNQIQALKEYDFTQDYHVKTMFVFAPGTKFHDYELYLENKIILQDKATAMAVHLLAPPPGSIVLDMCAAPGMKTTQLAAYIRNNGIIYAIERNEKRYSTLCDFVSNTNSRCVKTIHRDILDVKRGEYMDVEYILLDPSCSGSGMDLSVHNYIEESRLAKLTSLQEKFLKHAMNSFPNAKRIVYSTCSIFPEENERVITNVVKTSRAKWRVQDVKELLKGQWKNFGSAMYGSIGTRCLYARPDSDFTTGFFLAVLDRDPKDLKKSELREAKRFLEIERYVVGNESINDSVSQEEDKLVNVNTKENDSKEIKKKKKHKNEKNGVNNILHNLEDLKIEPINESNDERVTKKRKNKSENVDSNVIIDFNTDPLQDVTDIPKKKKKKSEENGLTNVDNETECDVKIIKKKKRKHDKLENINNAMEVDDVTEVSKKKKKKKDESILSES